MAKKYQVFISSTFDDLKEHRDAVVKADLRLTTTSGPALTPFSR